MSLYNEQYPNPLYDSETGRTKPTAYVDILDVETEEAVRKAEALRGMQNSEGFKILEHFLKEQVSQIKESLPYITDNSGKIYRLQEAAKCYQNVLDYVEHHIRVGDFHKQRDNQQPK